MRVKVTTEFIDRHTGERHRVGEEIEVTQERYDEILKVGAFVKKATARRRKKPASE